MALAERLPQVDSYARLESQRVAEQLRSLPDHPSRSAFMALFLKNLAVALRSPEPAQSSAKRKRVASLSAPPESSTDAPFKVRAYSYGMVPGQALEVQTQVDLIKLTENVSSSVAGTMCSMHLQSNEDIVRLSLTLMLKQVGGGVECLTDEMRKLARPQDYVFADKLATDVAMQVRSILFNVASLMCKNLMEHGYDPNRAIAISEMLKQKIKEQ